jgi:hypothetical protein
LSSEAVLVIGLKCSIETCSHRPHAAPHLQREVGAVHVSCLFGCLEAAVRACKRIEQDARLEFGFNASRNPSPYGIEERLKHPKMLTHRAQLCLCMQGLSEGSTLIFLPMRGLGARLGAERLCLKAHPLDSVASGPIEQGPRCQHP